MRPATAGPDTRPPAIALLGATASGKTALALDWARDGGFEVVSIDSALVYRGLDIGAAKPDAAARAAVPHHLLDLRDPHEAYSAAELAADARVAMDAIRGRGRVPLLVGGTGLYFRALLRGLSELPEADPATRASLAEEHHALGTRMLHERLARLDPVAAARIHPNDPQRVLRALEVVALTGRPLSAQQRAARARCPYRVLKLALMPPRAVLHARIAARFDAMLDAGFLDEARRLRAAPGFDPDRPALRAVGYRQAFRHLDGATDAASFRAEALAATRQLAKRQTTWLRSEHDAIALDPASPGFPADGRRLRDAFLG